MKSNRVKSEHRGKRWKMKKEVYCEDFKEMLRHTLGSCEELSDKWVTAATMYREKSREVFSVSSRQSKDDKETF